MSKNWDNLVDESFSERQLPSTKRKRSSPLIGTMFEQGTGKGAAIKIIDGTFEQVSALLIQKLVYGQGGKIIQIRETKAGILQIETASDGQTKAAQNRETNAIPYHTMRLRKLSVVSHTSQKPYHPQK